MSKHISLLEKEVGVRLINRSTRSLSLTEAGEIFHMHSCKIIAQTDRAYNELKNYQDQPVGTLRVAAPVAFGASHLVPIVSKVRDACPGLKIELLLEDRVVNIVEEGVDLSFRCGWLGESNLVAKKLYSSPMRVFSAPSYLKKYGMPEKPEELASHQWVSLSLLKSPLRWTFHRGDESITVQLQSHVRTNSLPALVSLVSAGQGISVIAEDVIRSQLHAGELINILKDYQTMDIGVYAVYSHREHMPPKVRVFLDYAIQYFEDLRNARAR